MYVDAEYYPEEFLKEKASAIIARFIPSNPVVDEAGINSLAKFLQDEVLQPLRQAAAAKTGQLAQLPSSKVPMNAIAGPHNGQAAFANQLAPKDEQALLVANNERFTYMMAATFDVVWDWDIASSTIYYGAAYKKMFGYEPGLYSFSLDRALLEEIVYAEDVPIVEKSLKEVLASSKDHWQAEYRRLKQRGGYAVVASKAIIIRDAAGNAVRLVGAMQDITSRRNLMTALNNSVEKIWSLLQNVSDIITLVDKQGVIQYQSTADREVLGYDEFEVVGRNIYSLLHPDDKHLINIDASGLPDGPQQRQLAECRMLHKNGSYVFLEMQLNNQLYNPAIRGVILTSHNITQRKKRDEEKNELLHRLRLENEEKQNYAEALERSEKRYKFLFENSPAPMLMWDFKTLNILDANWELLKKYGYTRQEFLKLNIKQIRPVEDVPLILAATQNINTYGVTHKRVWRHCKKDGEVMFVEVSANLVEWDGRVVSVNHINDITEKLTTENALKESEARYRLLFYKSPLPKLIYDVNTLQIVDANDAFLVDYGYSLPELTLLTLQPLLLPKDLKRFTQMHEGNKGQSQALANWGMFTFKRKNKQKLIADVYANQISYKGVECILLSCINATERVATQEKIKNTSDRLRELATYLNDIREDDRANIAREIHDELGQQLTGIKMDVHWLKEEMPSLTLETRQQFDSILKLIDRTIGTVRKISTELRPIMLDDLGLLETLKLHSQAYEKRFGIKVDFVTDLTDLPVPPKTAINIFRVFQESLTNIARHSGASQVNCNIKCNNNKFILTIKDDGKGFDTLQVAEKKTLGLLGMRERIIMLEGDFVIHSHHGVGTEVVVTIPLAQAK